MPGTSKNRDGWTGEKCPRCNGTGEDEHDDFGRRPCGACGGTGEEYDPKQDDRKDN